MVLCKFFQQGTGCRFGSKCNNEHLDIKQLVKTDVESALNGKQWPFSCYGPFKDKPSIPNFIDDQSFEEIRLLCYEAKAKNFFEPFQQQFAKEALETTNKMKALFPLTPQVIEIVCKIYDAPVEGGGTTVAPAKTNNPFGMSGGGGGGGGNAFGGSTAFGVTPGSAGTSLFGAVSANPQQGSSIFGGGSQNATFAAQQQNSIFGQSAAKPANSMFGGGTSVFAQPQQAAVAPSSVGGGGGLFAQAAQQTNPTAGAPGGNVFAQAMAAQQPAKGFGLFSQAAQQTQPLFGQPGTFFSQQQLQQQQQTQPGLGLFQKPVDQPQSMAGGNLFAQVAPTQNFFQPPTAAAGPEQQQQQQFQQQQQQPASNPFSQAVAPPSGFFQQAMQQPPVTSAPAQQPLLQHSQQQVVEAPHNKLYSQIQQLSPEDLEAFRADQFTLGKIPLVPPPRELI